jgi:hypothetical protein
MTTHNWVPLSSPRSPGDQTFHETVNATTIALPIAASLRPQVRRYFSKSRDEEFGAE